ncbi:bifunctional protein GlmU [Alphaproteobacteria bacterium]|nr:bifunctional protein GlmU [Alphaproteobacteria bacterium]
MTKRAVAAIILAAGQGTRMKSSLPKVMHKIAGRPMIAHLLEQVEALHPEKIAVVVGPGMDSLEGAVAPWPTVLQKDRLGTGHAALQAEALIGAFDGVALILFGDTPLIAKETLEKMILRFDASDHPALVVLGFYPKDPGAYGRLAMRDERVEAIIEYNDATPEQKKIPLCNSGVMAVDGRILFPLLQELKNDNAKGEYYLTDLVAAVVAKGLCAAMVEGDEEELLGVNSRQDQATAEWVAQNRLRQKAMENGATLIDPSSVVFSWDTKLGRDVTVGPNVVFGAGVSIEDDVAINAFCHLEGAHVASGAVIGPFARLRPGAEIARAAHIGNFVEVKKATIAEGAKVNHLTYIGDAFIGAGANIGAGTITCNYDGFEKTRTHVGAGAFIGSNSSLVAPVSIGAGAIIGAGSVIDRDVAADSLAVERSSHREISGWAARFREKKSAPKD